MKHLCLSTWPCVSTDHNLQSRSASFGGGKDREGNSRLHLKCHKEVLSNIVNLLLSLSN